MFVQEFREVMRKWSTFDYIIQSTKKRVTLKSTLPTVIKFYA